MEHHGQEMLQKIEQGAEQLSSAHTEILNNVNHQADEKKTQMHELSDKIDQLHKGFEQHSQQAETLVGSFRDNVDHVVHDTKDATDHFATELTQVKSNHDEHAQDLIEHITQFVSHTGSIMDEMHSSVEHMTEQAIGQVGTQFAEQAVEALVGHSGPLHDAFEALQGKVGDSHDTFLGKFSEIAEKVEGITDAIKPCMPVIDAIKVFT